MHATADSVSAVTQSLSTGDAIVVWSTFAMAVLTFAMAIAAWRNVHLTRQLIETQVVPAISARVEQLDPGQPTLCFVMENTGRVAANDLQVSVVSPADTEVGLKLQRQVEEFLLRVPVLLPSIPLSFMIEDSLAQSLRGLGSTLRIDAQFRVSGNGKRVFKTSSQVGAFLPNGQLLNPPSAYRRNAQLVEKIAAPLRVIADQLTSAAKRP
ncbi:MAG: hypothetical protein KF902_10135 [Phycisphaeraceae bacterium]|nr:hypothetical protein [Phycisphaeraceae bacterium]